MVVHDDVADNSLSYVRSGHERHEDRKRSRRSKRRLSHGDSPVGRKRGATAGSKPPRSIYDVLLAIIFALTPNSERHAQGAFDILASFTSAKTRRLDEDAVVMLEEVFNVLSPRLDHLFYPFVHMVDIRDPAEDVLDIAHIVPIVEAEVNANITPTLTRAEIRERLEPLKYLHAILERTLRRRSM